MLLEGEETYGMEPGLGRLDLAIDYTLNYLMLTSPKGRNGPCSDNGLDPDGLRMRYAIVVGWYERLCGRTVEKTLPDQVVGNNCVCTPETGWNFRERWMLRRKKGSVKLKRRELLNGNGVVAQGFFKDLPNSLPSGDHIGAFVYCYSGKLAGFPRRVVKFGYTTKLLAEYLKSLGRQYAPRLIGRKPGARPLENTILEMWNRLLCDGKEWFSPDAGMLDWVLENFQCEPNARKVVDELLGKMDGFFQS